MFKTIKITVSICWEFLPFMPIVTIKESLHLISCTGYKNIVLLDEFLHTLIYSELRDLEPGYYGIP